MIWEAAHPVLYLLPVIICLLLHILISAGFLLDSRPGIYRLLIYSLSCVFFMGYFLLFINGFTLATTSVQIDFASRYLKYESYSGITRIPAEEILAVVLEGQAEKPSKVWVQSKDKVFYMDRHFDRLDEFVPLLQSIAEFETVRPKRGLTIYLSANGAEPLNPERYDRLWPEHTRYFLPWLAVYIFIAYIKAGKGWQGDWRSFQLLALLYSGPVLVLSLLLKPALPLAIFLIIYPTYPVYLSAMCLHDSQ